MMASWITRGSSSHTVHLIATASISACLAVVGVLSYQEAQRRFKIARAKADIPDISQEHAALNVSAFYFPFSSKNSLVRLRNQRKKYKLHPVVTSICLHLSRMSEKELLKVSA